jgi:hypothetical protein
LRFFAAHAVLGRGAKLRVGLQVVWPMLVTTIVS